MKNRKIEIKWALVFIAAGLLWILLERLTGLHSTHIDKHPTYSNFFAIPAIVVYVLALLDKRKNFYGGKMTYIQGLISGLVITGIIALLSPLSQLAATFISPHYFDNASQYAIENELMDPEQANRYFSLNNYMIQGAIGAIVMGILTSAVLALVVRRR